jgi:5-methylcytosine-specific restriction protein A
VCGFNFEEAFGSIGKGFIHVHHIKPLSKIKKGYIVDPIKDLIPMCPNCHSMIHKGDPPYTVEKLKTIIQGNNKGNS